MTAAEQWLPKLVIGLARGERCLPQRSSPGLDLSLANGGLSDARWKIVESSKDDIEMCSLAKHGEVFGAVLSQTI